MLKFLFRRQNETSGKAESFDLLPTAQAIDDFHLALKDAKRIHKNAISDKERDKAWTIFNQQIRDGALRGDNQAILNVSHVYKAMAICLRREKNFKQALHHDVLSVLYSVEYRQRDMEAIEVRNNSLPKKLRRKDPLPSSSRNYLAAWEKEWSTQITSLAKTNKHPDLAPELEQQISEQFLAGSYMSHCADVIKSIIDKAI